MPSLTLYLASKTGFHCFIRTMKTCPWGNATINLAKRAQLNENEGTWKALSVPYFDFKMHDALEPVGGAVRGDLTSSRT